MFRLIDASEMKCIRAPYVSLYDVDEDVDKAVVRIDEFFTRHA